MRADVPLARRAIHGTAYVIAGHAASHALRLAGNLVLTRLLFPDAFGLMALVLVVIVGVHLFSDVGLRGSIIYHERGDDPAFLNTAWTLQIIRGVALSLVIAVIAWPIAIYYGKPELKALLPSVGVSAIFEGLASTARFTLIRRISPARQVAMEISGRILSLCVMVPWALVSPSVWALAAGAMSMSMFNAFISHILIPGYKNRLALDRTAVKALFHYGRWIIPSTLLSFILSQGDRLFLGKVLSADQLGVYSIAFMFIEALLQPVNALASSILQPLYARLAERGTEEMRRHMYKARGLLLLAAVPCAWVFVIFGSHIIRFLYDPRYWQAGWMLQILSIGAVGSIVIASADRAMLALGDSWRFFGLQLVRFLIFFAGILIGFTYAGLEGFLFGLVFARILDYVPLAFFLRHHDVWMPKLDLAVLGISLAVISTARVMLG